MQTCLQFGTTARWEGISIFSPPATARYLDKATTDLEVFVVPLELPAQALKLAASEDGSAVLALQLVLLLGDLGLPLLQVLELFLLGTMFFELCGEQGLK